MANPDADEVMLIGEPLPAPGPGNEKKRKTRSGKKKPAGKKSVKKKKGSSGRKVSSEGISKEFFRTGNSINTPSLVTEAVRSGVTYTISMAAVLGPAIYIYLTFGKGSTTEVLGEASVLILLTGFLLLLAPVVIVVNILNLNTIKEDHNTQIKDKKLQVWTNHHSLIENNFDIKHIVYVKKSGRWGMFKAHPFRMWLKGINWTPAALCHMGAESRCIYEIGFSRNRDVSFMQKSRRSSAYKMTKKYKRIFVDIPDIDRFVYELRKVKPGIRYERE